MTLLRDPRESSEWHMAGTAQSSTAQHCAVSKGAMGRPTATDMILLLIVLVHDVRGIVHDSTGSEEIQGPWAPMFLLE